MLPASCVTHQFLQRVGMTIGMTFISGRALNSSTICDPLLGPAGQGMGCRARAGHVHPHWSNAVASVPFSTPSSGSRRQQHATGWSAANRAIIGASLKNVHTLVRKNPTMPHHDWGDHQLVAHSYPQPQTRTIGTKLHATSRTAARTMCFHCSLAGGSGHSAPPHGGDDHH